MKTVSVHIGRLRYLSKSEYNLCSEIRRKADAQEPLFSLRDIKQAH